MRDGPHDRMDPYLLRIVHLVPEGMENDDNGRVHPPVLAPRMIFPSVHPCIDDPDDDPPYAGRLCTNCFYDGHPDIDPAHVVLPYTDHLCIDPAYTDHSCIGDQDDGKSVGRSLDPVSGNGFSDRAHEQLEMMVGVAMVPERIKGRRAERRRIGKEG